MIRINDINSDNFRDIINMKMPEGQNFVAPNVFSLAQAWLYADYARPHAIYNDDTLVGFLLLAQHDDKRTLGLWRIMIAQEHQGKGYGQETVKMVIAQAKASGKYDEIQLDYVPGNDKAVHIYEKLGFVHTGEVKEGEIFMRLTL